MYENHSFLQKKWLNNAISWTRDTRDKIRANSTCQNTLRYLTIYSVDLPNLPKYLRYLKKEKKPALIGCLYSVVRFKQITKLVV